MEASERRCFGSLGIRVGVRGGLGAWLRGGGIPRTTVVPTGDGSSPVVGQSCGLDPDPAHDAALDAAAAATLIAGPQCVAEQGRMTRGWIRPECLIDDRATQPGATYQVGECKGKTTVQGEAVAQARAVAQLNQQRVYGQTAPPGSITTNIQWETYVSPGRVDLLLYDRRDPTGEVGLVEIKGSWNGNAAAAQDQLNRYLQANPKFGTRDVVAYDFNKHPFTPDEFQINRCTSSTDPHINVYTTHSVAINGVLVIDRARQPCPRRSGWGSHSSENGSVDLVLGVDENGNGNDDSFDKLKAYASGHGMTKLVDMLPSHVNVTFAQPLHVHLTSRQVKSVIYSLTALAASIKPAAAGQVFLKAVSQGIAGDVGGLATTLHASSSAAQGAEAWLASNPPEAKAAADLVRAVRASAPVSRQMIADAADELAPQLARVLTVDAATTQSGVETFLTEWAAGASFAEAEAAAGLPELAAEGLESVVTAELTEAGFISLGAPFVGLGILIIGTALVLGIDWSWNIWGDPHLITIDGLKYDLQSVGEFHLLEVADDGIDIQARYQPWGTSTSVSVTTALAFNLGDTSIEIRSNGDLYADGELVDQAALMKYSFDSFGDGSALTRQAGRYTVVFPSGDALLVEPNGNYLNASFRALPGTKTSGLLGNNDGIAGNDLKTSAGESIAATDTAKIHGRYADSWRVSDFDSLFTYDSGQSTESFTDRAFPSTVTTIADFPANEIEAASDTCRGNNVPDGPQFDDCVYDLLVTGDAQLAKAAAATPDDVVDPTVKGFDQNGVLAEDFTAPVAKNFAFSTYLNDPATSRVAGPIYDTPGYSFYAVDVPRHHKVEVTLDLIAYGPIDTDTTAQSADISVDGHSPISVPLEGDQAPASASDAATLTRLRSGTTAAGTPFSVYRLDAITDHVGSGLKVSVAPHGFRGVLGTWLGVNNVRLELSTTPPDLFDVQIPFGVGGPWPSPGAGAGSLETTSAEDDYRFTLTDTHDLLLDADGCLAAQVALVARDTGSLVSPDHSGCGDRLFEAVPPGNYVLRVWVTGPPANYALSVVTAPEPERFDYTPGQLVADGRIEGELRPGAGDVETYASVDVYDFTVSAGQQDEYLELNKCPPGLEWTLLDADRTIVRRGACGEAEIRGLSAGPYSLEVRDRSDAALPAEYDLALVPIPPDAAPGALTVDGDPLTLTTTSAGQNGWMTFQGTQGQRIQFETSGSTFPSNVYWYVAKPDGSVLFDSGHSNWFFDVTTLPATGTYKFFVDPQGTDVGSLTAKVWSVPDDVDGGSFAVDGPAATLTTTSAGQNGWMTFQGTQGQRIQFLTSGSTFPSNVYWYVAKPDGSVLFDSGHSNWFIDVTTLPATGTYKFFVDPQGTDVGSLTAKVWSVPDDVDGGSFAVDGPAATLTTTSAGQNGWMTFQGTQGQRIQFQTSGSTFPSNVYWYVAKPDGSVLFDSGHSNWFIDVTTLPATGTYKFVVNPQGTDVGSLTARASNVSGDIDGGSFTVDGPAATITTHLAGQNGWMTFQGTQGQRIQFLTSGSTFPSNVYWYVAKPDGSVLFDSGHSNWFFDVTTLPATGTYKFFVDPQGTDVGSLTAKVWSVPDDVDGGSFAVDGPAATLTTTSAGQNGWMTFQGTQGQRIQFLTSGSTFPSNVYWYVAKPDGSVLFDSGHSNWFIDVTTLPATGTYKFFVDPQGTDVGSLTAKVWSVPPDVDGGVLSVDGPAATLTTTSAGQNGWMTFQGTQGQRIQFQTSGSTFPSNVYWYVAKPDGSVLFNSGHSNWFIDVTTLPATGTYKFVVNPQGTDVGSLTAKVWNAP